MNKSYLWDPTKQRLFIHGVGRNADARSQLAFQQHKQQSIDAYRQVSTNIFCPEENTTLEYLEFLLWTFTAEKGTTARCLDTQRNHCVH